MEAAHAIHLPKGHYPARIVSIKVRVGEEIKCDAPLIIYEFEQTETEVGACERDDGRVRTRRRRLELLSPYEGKVESINVTVGQEVDQANSAMATIVEPCSHAVQWHGQCGLCGKDLSISDFNGSHTSRATINMAHDVLGLTVSHQEAARLEQVTTKRLLASRKLSLIVDLDQTIIHATVDPTVGEWRNDRNNVNHEATRDIAQFILPDSPTVYYIKLRPNAREFLKAASERYELHIYTMGTRSYASKVAEVIDPDGTIFQERVLSRDESGSVTQKTLQRLFPCDTSMVVVIDDRADVWGWSPNLVKVRPYDFFVGIGDINGAFLPKVATASKHEEVRDDKVTPEGTVHAPREQESEDEEEVDQLSLERQEQAHRRTMERQQKSRPLEKQQQRQGNQRRPVLIDNDDELSTVLDVLREVHRRFYEKGEAESRDVRLILPEMKQQVLRGVTVAFSSIIPLGVPQETTEIWRLAESFGARCASDIGPSVTHLVAAKRGTAKVNAAKKISRIYTVKVEWLLDSIAKWWRQKEEDYLFDYGTPDDQVYTERLQPEVTAAELAGESAPVAERPLDDRVTEEAPEDEVEDGDEEGEVDRDDSSLPSPSETHELNQMGNVDWKSALSEVDEALREGADDGENGSTYEHYGNDDDEKGSIGDYAVTFGDDDDDDDDGYTSNTGDGSQDRFTRYGAEYEGFVGEAWETSPSPGMPGSLSQYRDASRFRRPSTRMPTIHSEDGQESGGSYPARESVDSRGRSSSGKYAESTSTAADKQAIKRKGDKEVNYGEDGGVDVRTRKRLRQEGVGGEEKDISELLLMEIERWDESPARLRRLRRTDAANFEFRPHTYHSRSRSGKGVITPAPPAHSERGRAS